MFELKDMIKRTLINLIEKYQKHWSPTLQKNGVKCIHELSCSHYALKVIKKHHVPVALFMIGWRLASCNPINARFKLKKNNQ